MIVSTTIIFFYSFSAVIDFKLRNLTYIAVRYSLTLLYVVIFYIIPGSFARLVLELKMRELIQRYRVLS